MSMFIEKNVQKNVNFFNDVTFSISSYIWTPRIILTMKNMCFAYNCTIICAQMLTHSILLYSMWAPGRTKIPSISWAYAQRYDQIDLILSFSTKMTKHAKREIMTLSWYSNKICWMYTPLLIRNRPSNSHVGHVVALFTHPGVAE